MIRLLTGLLDPDEREIVLGDLAECGASKWQALGEIAELVARRQAVSWTRWRPWTATMALLVPLGVLLSWQSFLTSGRSATTLWLYFNNWDSGLLALPAFRHDFPLFLAATLYELLTLASWSWAVGFAIGSSSPKTAPLNGLLLFLLLCCGALWESLWQANLPGQHGPVSQNLFYRAIFPLLVQMSLVLLPALFGMGVGVRLPAARKVAPDFLLKDAAGKGISLKSYRGKVVMVDFWATWCTGCKQEIPWFIDLQKTYGMQGFAVVGVSVDDDGWKVLTPFLAEHQIPYKMVLGGQPTMQLFGLASLPDTFLIDQEGRIAAAYKGGLVDRDNIEENIRALLVKR